MDGFDLCQYQVKAHESIHGAVTVLGQMPRINVERSFTMRDWPPATDAFQLVQDVRFDYNIIQRFELLNKKSCLWVDGDRLVPVWQLKLKQEN